MNISLRFVENKATGISEEPSKGVAELVFNRYGACLMCGHTPMTTLKGLCCRCDGCICCTKKRRD